MLSQAMRDRYQVYLKDIDFANPETQEDIKTLILQAMWVHHGEVNGSSMSDVFLNMHLQPFLNESLEDFENA